MLLLLEVLHPDPPVSLYRAIMFHDLHERYSGDLPGFTKRMCPALRDEAASFELQIGVRMGIPAAHPDDLAWVKALDRIELLLWCEDQKAFGNRHCSVTERDIRNWISINWDKIPGPCQDFLKHYQWKRTGDEL